MLKVRTIVKESRIHGLGLFAAEFIPAGTVVWEFTDRFDFTFTDEEWDTLDDLGREFFDMYAYYKDGLYYVPVDDGRYVNHSDNPNTGGENQGKRDIALRDIQPGEELTQNYWEISDLFTGFPDVSQTTA